MLLPCGTWNLHVGNKTQNYRVSISQKLMGTIFAPTVAYTSSQIPQHRHRRKGNKMSTLSSCSQWPMIFSTYSQLVITICQGGDRSLVGLFFSCIWWTAAHQPKQLKARTRCLSESPVHSSSSDDFAGLLERELDSGSSESSPDQEDKEADSDVESESRIKRRKGDNLESMEETNGSTSQGLSEQNSEASATEDTCAHPGSFGDMCFLCGRRLIEQSGVTFGYIHKPLQTRLYAYDDQVKALR